MPCPICTAVYVLPPPQAFLWVPRAATQPAHIPFPGRRSARPGKAEVPGPCGSSDHECDRHFDTRGWPGHCPFLLWAVMTAPLKATRAGARLRLRNAQGGKTNPARDCKSLPGCTQLYPGRDLPITAIKSPPKANAHAFATTGTGMERRQWNRSRPLPVAGGGRRRFWSFSGDCRAA